MYDGPRLVVMDEPSGNPSFFKKWVMRQYWRMQQSQAVVSLLLWGTTITLLVWPYLRWRFEPGCGDGMFCFDSELFGIPLTYVGLVTIFMAVMFGVFTVGFLYDQVFSLWTEWRNVDTERNPFATYALSPIWLVLFALQAETLKRQLGDDEEEMKEQIDWYLKWCKSYTEGEMFARAVQQWDKDLGETPTFWFTDEDAMKKARELKLDDDNN